MLWQAIQVYPASAVITYNPACYACVLGETDGAKRLLERAFAIDPKFRGIAVDDPDLEPIFGDRTST